MVHVAITEIQRIHPIILKQEQSVAVNTHNDSRWYFLFESIDTHRWIDLRRLTVQYVGRDMVNGQISELRDYSWVHTNTFKGLSYIDSRDEVRQYPI